MFKIIKLQIITILSLSIGFLLAHNVCFAESWQDKLEQYFDIVETFDELQDWIGTGYGDVTTGSDMPKKIGGGKSIWGYYSNWNSSTSGNWIGDHGSSNNWRGTGKSLLLDYGGSGGRGPNRLAFYSGDGDPSSGYSECYVFYMGKYPKAFFPMSGSSFQYFSYLKLVHISTGFSDIWNWGSSSEQSSCHDIQCTSIYGRNYTITSFYPDGSDLWAKALIRTGSSISWNDIIFSNDASSGGPVLADEWVGIEYRFKKSQPSGASNGIVETWVYDQSGNVIGHDSFTGKTFEGGYDHNYNKFNLGGNRASQFDGTVGIAYIDDFIVDNSRIGTGYFNLVNGSVNPTRATPENLRFSAQP
jgi:hypothetical protein